MLSGWRVTRAMEEYVRVVHGDLERGRYTPSLYAHERSDTALLSARPHSRRRAGDQPFLCSGPET